MSVTFWVPKAGHIEKSEPCICNNAGCAHCDGTGVYKYSDYAAPSLNLANVNARSILNLLEASTDECLCGGLSPEDIPPVRQQILRLRNVTRQRQPALREATESGGEGTGQCQCFVEGYTDEQVLDRLTRLDAVLAYAQEHQMEVSWG